MFHLAKKQGYTAVLVLITTVLFFSCQKTLDYETVPSTGITPDLTSKVSSSVSGFVTDENDAAVNGASVQVGSSTVTTDKYGYFEVKNAQVVKEAAVVTVSRNGYFKGIKTYIAQEGKAAFFRIKLIPKTVIGTISGASGGIIAQPNGFSIKLTGGSIVNASTNALYNGPVTVAAFWIKPTASDLPNIMPGDLRGTDADGYLKLLQTYGMAAVELTGASGEQLQIVNGQKATLTIPLPSTLTATAPASIPLWYFDEAKGLWKQEGTATKTGSMYTCEVAHFSFWNCDVPANYVQFNCTLKNAAGNPLPYTLVKVTVVGTTNSGWGYTDSSGYVGGAVPNNSNLLLEVFASNGCSNAIYSQTFTTTNVNISLGTITVNTAANSANLNGTVTNCASTAVTNGYIIIKEGSVFTRYPLNNSGAYSINRIFCTLPQTITLVGEDMANQQQSADVTYVVNAGSNTVANIQACGQSTQQFINYSINTNNYSFTFPAHTFTFMLYNQPVAYLIGANDPQTNANGSLILSSIGITVGGTVPLINFFASQVNDSLNITSPIPVNIIEYGAIGQFMSGNFTGTFTGRSPANTQYNVTCNFRVRRAM